MHAHTHPIRSPQPCLSHQHTHQKQKVDPLLWRPHHRPLSLPPQRHLQAAAQTHQMPPWSPHQTQTNPQPSCLAQGGTGQTSRHSTPKKPSPCHSRAAQHSRPAVPTCCSAGRTMHPVNPGSQQTARCRAQGRRDSRAQRVSRESRRGRAGGQRMAGPRTWATLLQCTPFLLLRCWSGHLHWRTGQHKTQHQPTALTLDLRQAAGTAEWRAARPVSSSSSGTGIPAASAALTVAQPPLQQQRLMPPQNS